MAPMAHFWSTGVLVPRIRALPQVDEDILTRSLVFLNRSHSCAADGKTYRDALANVEVVIREWIETAKELGRPIPAPKGRLVFA